MAKSHSRKKPAQAGAGASGPRTRQDYAHGDQRRTMTLSAMEFSPPLRPTHPAARLRAHPAVGVSGEHLSDGTRGPGPHAAGEPHARNPVGPHPGGGDPHHRDRRRVGLPTLGVGHARLDTSCVHGSLVTTGAFVDVVTHVSGGLAFTDGVESIDAAVPGRENLSPVLIPTALSEPAERSLADEWVLKLRLPDEAPLELLRVGVGKAARLLAEQIGTLDSVNALVAFDSLVSGLASRSNECREAVGDGMRGRPRRACQRGIALAPASLLQTPARPRSRHLLLARSAPRRRRSPRPAC
jgi:hypothetical protein